MLGSLLRTERAACNLEGGGRSPSEGLAHSRAPCARVLSVAGLLASFGLFPGSGWFILEERKAPFWPEEPSLFNLRIKSVKCPSNPRVNGTGRRSDVHGEAGREAYIPGGGRGVHMVGIYQGG